jgi:transmembrane sensor
MTPSEIDPLLLEKYLNNQCTDTERELVETWYASLKGTQDHLDRLPEKDRTRLRRETFGNIQSKIHESEPEREKEFPWRWITGIAASIILVLGLYFQFGQKPQAFIAKSSEIEVSPGDSLIHFVNHEPRIVMHKLPDNSTVWMHADASITYPEKFEMDKREVVFTGEAFFDITKDKSRPFSIRSGEMIIKVLGTSFNVKAPAARKVFQISVVTGSVEVSAPDQQQKDQQVILKPKQEVFFETLSKRLIVSTIPVSAKKEIYQPITVMFRDTPLNQVVEQLRKKFNIEILLSNPEMATCQVSADFEQQSLPVIMEMLCTTLDASYTMSDKAITLTGVPCD